jgi:hypothetical protein
LRVPVDDLPPVTSVGLRESAIRTGGFRVKIPGTATDPNFAVIDTFVFEATALVAVLNVSLKAPSGIFTDAGTPTSMLPLNSFTTNPPLGASPFNDTVPVEGLPPVTADGSKETEAKPTGTMVKVAVCEEDPNVAEIVAVCCEVTADVAIENVADVFPEAMVTVGGIVARRLLLPRLTTIPPGPATAPIATVPIEVEVPAIVDGFNWSEVMVTGWIESVACTADPLIEVKIVA